MMTLAATTPAPAPVVKSPSKWGWLLGGLFVGFLLGHTVGAP